MKCTTEHEIPNEVLLKHLDDVLLANNQTMIDLLVYELQRRGVYPDETVDGKSVFEMVRSHGAYWHIRS